MRFTPLVILVWRMWWTIRVRRADGGITGVSLTISGIMCTLGDGALSGSVGGRLRPLRRKERVFGGLCATGIGGTRGTVFWIGGVATLGDVAFDGDGVGAIALVLQNISASCRSAESWASLIGANGVLG